MIVPTLITTHKREDGEKGERDGSARSRPRQFEEDAGQVGAPPRISEVTEGDEPEEGPQA